MNSKSRIFYALFTAIEILENAIAVRSLRPPSIRQCDGQCKKYEWYLV